jgi:hypothetical protein
MPTIAQFGLSWGVLRKHLVPRRHRAVRPGTRHVFAPGVLRAADLVICKISDRQLEVGVPVEVGRASASFGVRHAVTLTVSHNRDGSVTASCYRAKR